MSEEPKTQNQADGNPTPPPAVAEEAPISLEELDNLLAAEDPSFLTEFSGLRDEKFDVDLEVENFNDVEQAIEHPTQAPTPAAPKQSPVKKSAEVVSTSVADMVSSLFNSIVSFPRMPLKQKASVSVVVALIGLLIFIGVRVYHGELLPSFELQFLNNFKNSADKSYTIEKGEPFEDFDNPLRHPDFVVLIERLVVNLRSSKASDNPMGMFEFYIEASSQEGAIEINERQKEVRDMMARTLESDTYEELATSEGKDRAKLTLRRELNTLLTSGRVRRVFFKTILLKP